MHHWTKINCAVCCAVTIVELDALSAITKLMLVVDFKAIQASVES